MTRAALIILAVIMLAGCGSGDGSAGSAMPAASCCTPGPPGIPCVIVERSGTPVAATCVDAPTPTPGGTPGDNVHGCLCIVGFTINTPSRGNPTPMP